MGRIDDSLHAQAEPELHERRGHIAVVGGADKAWIAIKLDLLGNANPLDELGDRPHRGFGPEIPTGRLINDARGPDIERIEDLDDVLLFALGVGRHRAGTLKIQLQARHQGLAPLGRYAELD